MKKKLFILVICMISVLFLTGCSIMKRAINAEEFNKITEEQGMVAVDAKEQFADNDEIETATIAVNTNDGWQIEHYYLTTKEDAKRMFSKNKSLFENEKTSGSKTSTVEVGNYTKYTLETDTLFMVASRIDNTFLYAKVPIEYKDAAISFIEATGY